MPEIKTKGYDGAEVWAARVELFTQNGLQYIEAGEVGRLCDAVVFSDNEALSSGLIHLLKLAAHGQVLFFTTDVDIAMLQELRSRALETTNMKQLLDVFLSFHDVAKVQKWLDVDYVVRSIDAECLDSIRMLGQSISALCDSKDAQQRAAGLQYQLAFKMLLRESLHRLTLSSPSARAAITTTK